MAEATNPILFVQKHLAHVSNITTLCHIQSTEYGTPSTMITIKGAESAAPLYCRKGDISEAVGLRVKVKM